MADERQTHEHDWDGGYPWRQCLECGEEEEAPEPDYDDPEDEL